MDYYRKYLKYKTKYTLLRKQIGSAPEDFSNSAYGPIFKLYNTMKDALKNSDAFTKMTKEQKLNLDIFKIQPSSNNTKYIIKKKDPSKEYPIKGINEFGFVAFLYEDIIFVDKDYIIRFFRENFNFDFPQDYFKNLWDFKPQDIPQALGYIKEEIEKNKF